MSLTLFHSSVNSIQNPKTEYTPFLNAHETLSRTDHILDHKTSLNKFTKIEIISNTFFKHNGLTLEITGRKTEKLQVEIKQHTTEQLSHRRSKKLP